MEKFICPICNKSYEFALHTWQDENKKWYCEHDKADTGRKGISLKRHENYDASMMALKMAVEQKRMDLEMGVNKEVPVQSYQKGSFGKTEMLPQKVIESLEKKIAPELQE